MSLFGKHQPTNMNIFAAPSTERVVYRDTGSDTVAVHFKALSNHLKEDVKQVTAQRDEFAEAYQTAESLGIERRAINAGLRAVLREALGALHAQNPNHPLLDKKVRQKMFEQFEKDEFNKVIEMRKANNNFIEPVIRNYPQRPNEHILEDI